jgi:hypothetical protein
MDIHECKGICTECVPVKKEEHRGSRMPDLLRECAVDPLFADAVFREFAPSEETIEEKEGK